MVINTWKIIYMCMYFLIFNKIKEARFFWRFVRETLTPGFLTIFYYATALVDYNFQEPLLPIHYTIPNTYTLKMNFLNVFSGYHESIDSINIYL